MYIPHRIFESENDHTAAATPARPAHGMKFPGPLALWKLEEQLIARPSKEALSYARTPLANFGDTWVVPVSPTLVKRLAELSSEEVTEVADEWSSSEEVHAEAVDWETADDILHGFASFARDAVDRDGRIYMWVVN